MSNLWGKAKTIEDLRELITSEGPVAFANNFTGNDDKPKPLFKKIYMGLPGEIRLRIDNFIDNNLRSIEIHAVECLSGNERGYDNDGFPIFTTGNIDDCYDMASIAIGCNCCRNLINYSMPDEDSLSLAMIEHTITKHPEKIFYE